MLHTTLINSPLNADDLHDPGLLLEIEDRAAMSLLRLVAAAALAVTLLGLALRVMG